MYRRITVTSALLVGAAIGAYAQVEADRAQRIDAIFGSLTKPGSPGAVIAVIEHGKLVYQKGYGLANLEYNIPIRPDTIFDAASVSKQFTAMAVVLLESDGKLSIDDDVRKYLPELPDYGHRITLRNLLQHTSGIRDDMQTLTIAGWSMEDVITQEQRLRMLFRQKELNFPPGSQYMYSNSGYTLLAEIVYRVSGKELSEFCDERIFRPLSMAHTHFHQNLHRIVPGRADSYGFVDGVGFVNFPLNVASVGATGVFTTAADLAKWLDNFRVPRVGGPKAIARMLEQGVLTNGQKTNYGLGVVIEPFRGLKTISHDGGEAGYRSTVWWFPDQELGVAVLSNLASFDQDQAAGKIAELFLAGKMTDPPPQPTRTFVALGISALRPFAGLYPLPGQVVEINVDREKLWLSAADSPVFEMKALAPNHFYVDEVQADVEFIAKPNGGMTAKIKQAGVVRVADRELRQPLAAADLNDYVGVYWSEELETQYTIRVRDGKLFAVHAHHGEFELTPLIKDQFKSATYFFTAVKFLRDEKSKVNALTVSLERVTAVRFDKK